MNEIGYMTRRADGKLYGERGAYYDYITAQNGVFIEAENSLLAARIPVTSETTIRGLGQETAKVVLRHGPIPQLIFDAVQALFVVGHSVEHYAAIVWNGTRYDVMSDQSGTPGQVKYERQPDTIVDFHSHMGSAFFSNFGEGSDNFDEQGFRIYGVIGLSDMSVRIRVGVYGYWYDVPWGDIFSGELVGVRDMNNPSSWEKNELKDALEDALEAKGLKIIRTKSRLQEIIDFLGGN